MIKRRSKNPRRLGFERRVFSYDVYSPERRSGKDRRRGLERRRKTEILKWA